MKSLLENIDLMTYKINFNYEKKAVYHTIFGVLISICIYGFLILLIKYFVKDFLYKTNPRVIYQETEFNYNFSIPMNFILNQYSYRFFNFTKYNHFNLSSNEDSKYIYNQTNKFFSFYFSILCNNYIMYLRMIDTIDIYTLRTKDENGDQIFLN